MIIWLASYPRSGNTLLRTILFQCLGRRSYADEAGPIHTFDVDVGGIDVPEPWPEFYRKATDSTEVHLVKTHLPPRDDQPVIHVVRDARMSIASYHEFHRHFVPDSTRTLTEILLGVDYYGDWSTHYRSWAKQSRRLLLRFEDLVTCSDATLNAIAGFIEHRSVISPWRNPIQAFHEQAPHFFRDGRTIWARPAEWDDMTDAIFHELRAPLMQELGYLNADSFAATTLPQAIRDVVSVSRSLINDKRELQRICDDRLILINGQARENRQFQQIVNVLKSEARDRQCTIDDLRILTQESDNLKPLINIALSRLKHFVETSSRRLKAPRGARIMILGPILHRVDAWIRKNYWMNVEVLNQHPPRPLRHEDLPPARTPDSDLPSIAIVTPSFQQAAYIERTLRSVLSQHYPHLEYRVQDGGSKDGTVDILSRYQNQLTYWVSTPDAGQTDAIITGFSKSKGEIMGWLNSDDILLPGALHFVGDYFARHPDVDVIYGHRIIINEDDQEIGRWLLHRHDPVVLGWADYIPQETLFWRRRIWDKVGGLDPSFSFAMDWDLLLRFQAAGARMIRLPHFWACFRVHSKQKTSIHLTQLGEREMTLLRSRLHGQTVDRTAMSALVHSSRIRSAVTSLLLDVGIRW